MNWVDLEYFDIFHEESCDNLNFLEELISNISDEIQQADLDHLFRVFHSLKGLAGMMGFNELSEANHLIESNLKQYRSGQNLENVFKNWLLQARDVLQDMVAIIHDAVQGELPSAPNLEDLLKKVILATENIFGQNSINELEQDFESFSEQFSELTESLMQAMSESNYDEVVLIIHTLKGDAGACDLKELTDFFHKLEDFIDKDENNFFKLATPIHDTIISYLEQKDPSVLKTHSKEIESLFKTNHFLKITPAFIGLLKEFITELNFSIKQDESSAKLLNVVQSIFRDISLKNCGELEAQLMTVEMSGWDNLKANPYVKDLIFTVKEIISSQIKVSSTDKTIAMDEKKIVSPISIVKKQGQETFKIETRYINQLMDLSGEFIVAKNILVHNLKQMKQSKNSSYKELEQVAATINRLCDSLQDSVMNMRLIPCKEVFRKAPKIVRDISSKLNKQINLQIEGEDTEVDKFMADKISDALLHIIRNSCDHGIESPQQRLSNGKNAVGNVILRASHDKAFLKIDIIDDGAGVNTDKVLEKIISNELITEYEANSLSDDQIANFIFHPGLSTADQLSDISGRGVGMDVVKTNIEGLGGRVILSSTKGEGTHFEIFLPLNTTVKKCLITKFNGEFNAFSIDQISETIKINKDQVVERLGKYYFYYRDQVIEIINYVESENKLKIILTNLDSKMIALKVDDFLGWEELVVKQSPPLLQNILGVIGVSVLGDGTAILVNDVLQLVSGYRTEVVYAA